MAYLNVELLGGGQVGEARRVVVDVGDGDVHRGGGVEPGPAVVAHHHLQAVLAELLSVQSRPVHDLPCEGRRSGVGLWLRSRGQALSIRRHRLGQIQQPTEE